MLRRAGDSASSHQAVTTIQASVESLYVLCDGSVWHGLRNRPRHSKYHFGDSLFLKRRATLQIRPHEPYTLATHHTDKTNDLSRPKGNATSVGSFRGAPSHPKPSANSLSLWPFDIVSRPLLRRVSTPRGIQPGTASRSMASFSPISTVRYTSTPAPFLSRSGKTHGNPTCSMSCIRQKRSQFFWNVFCFFQHHQREGGVCKLLV